MKHFITFLRFACQFFGFCLSNINRIIDRKGNKTAKLAERFPVLVKRKFLVQIGGAMAFVIVFGLISLLLDLPIKVFFIVCGVVVGVINGMAVTLMYRD